MLVTSWKGISLSISFAAWKDSGVQMLVAIPSSDAWERVAIKSTLRIHTVR